MATLVLLQPVVLIELGQVRETHSIAAGLDYPGVGPEIAWLVKTQRAGYAAATDADALEAFQVLSQTEGIIPALESSHAIAELIARAPKMRRDELVILNVSGRGDKDMEILARHSK